MNDQHNQSLTAITLFLIATMHGFFNRSCATEVPIPQPLPIGQLQAGAFAKPINPKTMPVWVNGNIAGIKSDRINDPLHARSLVMSDGKSTVAICLVDSCVLPIELIDQAKDMIRTRTGIPPSHTMIAATHTHSSVSVMGAHGVPVQEDYAADLPGWIAESVEQAHKRLVPAQWGTASIDCDKYIYCRDWMMKQGKANSTLFSGRDGDSVSMNPGYDNPDRMAPVGTIDRMMPILSIQDLNGKPISILATFCTHYAGAPNISADYFGVVCVRLSKRLSPDNADAFVGIMSNSTSGNANCIDFSKPSVPFTYIDVGVYVADQILSAVPTINYSRSIELDAELQSLDTAVRMPSPKEVATAQRYIDTHFPDRLPLSLDESYARETVLLSQMPPTRQLCHHSQPVRGLQRNRFEDPST
jgi:neutral ceramidase